MSGSWEEEKEGSSPLSELGKYVLSLQSEGALRFIREQEEPEKEPLA